MSVSISSERPPLLFRHDDTLSLESFWRGPISTNKGKAVAERNVSHQIDFIKDHIENIADYDCYIITQYIQYLYINIFVTTNTSQIYQDVINGVVLNIANSWRNRKIKDRSLNNFIKTWINEDGIRGNSDKRKDHKFIDDLKITYDRLKPNKYYTEINDIFSVVYAIYNNTPIVVDNVILYRAALNEMIGFDKPTITLISTNRCVSIDTTQFSLVSDLYWKFIYSLNIQNDITGCGDLYYYLYLLASLALPLDPISLNILIKFNLSVNEKVGIPFLNYIAMYLKQKDMGFDYTISRLANPRRRITQQLHRFCGVGATFINNSENVKFLLDILKDKSEKLSKTEILILEQLDSIVDIKKVPFVREISYRVSYEESTEAVKAKISDTTNEDGEFSKDKDIEDPETDSEDSSETGDDNIGQSDNSDQMSDSRPSSKFLPLALPTETIDDHIYRLTILRFVSVLNNLPNPNITPEAFDVLKAWCSSLLFVATAETTRALISQLKLTGKLKELLK